MRNLILIFIVVLFSGCANYDFKLSDLKQERVKFFDLPERVKNFYQNPSEFGEDNASLVNFAYLDKDNSFNLKTIDTWYGPWVDYYKLINETKRLSYRIDQGTPIPIVVYDNKLYLVDKFNLFTNIEDYSTLVITRYELK